MIRHTLFSIALLACFSLSLPGAAIINTAHAAQNESSILHGKVTDVISTGDFTYIELETAAGKVWAAGPVTPVNRNDMIGVSTRTLMQNFHSKALGRTFSVIYFVNSFNTGKETSAAFSQHATGKKPQLSKSIIPVITDTTGEVKVGGLLREATLDGLNSRTKSFSDFKGKPLLINIWASWCGPCRAEMASLERLSQRYNKKAFNIIGISTDDYRDKAVDFIRQTGISFENFLDHKLLLENMLGAKTIPLTVLVDAEGRVLKKVRGSREWDNPEVIDAIAETFRIKLQH